MAKQKVYVLPGILGTSMDNEQPVLPNNLWVNPGRLALGQITVLKLAPGGIQPDPDEGDACFPTDVLQDYYGDAVDRLNEDLDDSKYDVIAWGYDWRRSLPVIATRLAGAIIGTTTPDEPVTIVAHSQGGLIARMVWFVLKGQGKDNLCRRIVTIGTPHEGCYSPAYVFAGEDEVISMIQLAESVTAGLFIVVGVPRPPGLPHSKLEIANVAASWPALYQLLPLVNTATLAADPLRAAMYDASNWPDSQAISATHLATAAGPWANTLNNPDSQPPTNVLIAVGSVGQGTAFRLDSVDAIGGTSAYSLNDQGDGRVPISSAIPPWANGYILSNATHGDLMKRQDVLGRLAQWVTADIPAPPIVYPHSSIPVMPGGQVGPIVQGPPFTRRPALWYDP